MLSLGVWTVSGQDGGKKVRKKMTLKEYCIAAKRTCAALTENEMLDHAVLGMAGEAGEIANLWKQQKHQKRLIDYSGLEEELGDLMWHVAEMCSFDSELLERILRRNITKLQRRYPDGFDSVRGNL
mgnify:CR=1 FL=1